MPSRKTLPLKDFYLSSADDPFVRPEVRKVKPTSAVATYKFSKPDICITPKHFDKHAMPIAFRALPEKLLEMTIKIVKTWPLPSVYEWKIEDICRWLRGLGYHQYQNTFRVNLVNGRTLLLLDASALSAINIKDFDHIRHIAYNIRCLFHFEMVNFARSINLPPQHYFELYKLLRVKNGTKYEISTQPVDLWRRMQLVRPPEALQDHWETLERWLRYATDKDKEIIAYTKRYDLYKSCKTQREPEPPKIEYKPCACMPPCECMWTEREMRAPWTLAFVDVRKHMSHIVPSDSTMNILSILEQSFPGRYGKIAVRNMENSFQVGRRQKEG